MSWDHRNRPSLAKLRNDLLHTQMVDVVGPFSPFYKERFAAAGIKPSSIDKVADLTKLPAVGERDLCPDGDPARAAGLVIQATETGYALHAPGPEFRKALARRLVDIDGYRRQVESDTRATSFTFEGLGFTFPVASTRGDLDVVARAGARLWQVLGLSSDDVLVAALGREQTAARVALEYAALASRSPALFAGSEPAALAATLRLVPATVLAVPVADGARLIDELADLDAPLESLTTLVVVGVPSPAEREAIRQALTFAGRGSVVQLAVHAPSGARVLWGECRAGATAGSETGLHTYPDLDIVELIDPESGAAAGSDQPAELALTQLGLRGSALLRWRTGDVITGGVDTAACPSCGRMVPRVLGVRRGALVPRFPGLGGEAAPIDLRSVAGALAGRADVPDWRVVLRPSAREGGDQLLVHLGHVLGADQSDVVVAVARDLRTAAGRLPTQLVAAEPSDLSGIDADPTLVGLSARIRVPA